MNGSDVAVQLPTVETTRNAVEAVNAPVAKLALVAPVIAVHVVPTVDPVTVVFCHTRVPTLPLIVNDVPDAAVVAQMLSLNPELGAIVPATGDVIKN